MMAFWRLALVFVFDVSRRATFESLPAQLARADAALRYGTARRARRAPPRVLVGAKADGGGARAPRGPDGVGFAEAEAFARERGMSYVECSALTGEGVETALCLPLAQLLAAAAHDAPSAAAGVV